MVAQILKKLVCKRCGEEFKPKTHTQVYCGRPCYNLSLKEDEHKYGYPTYKCYRCNKETQLDYDPVKEYKKLEAFVCPHCGHPRKETP
jgi:DNA-directed RNA polymerase subunit RPC12/RpoP